MSGGRRGLSLPLTCHLQRWSYTGRRGPDPMMTGRPLDGGQLVGCNAHDSGRVQVQIWKGKKYSGPPNKTPTSAEPSSHQHMGGRTGIWGDGGRLSNRALSHKHSRDPAPCQQGGSLLLSPTPFAACAPGRLSAHLLLMTATAPRPALPPRLPPRRAHACAL